MTEYVHPIHDGGAAREEQISPELVLVDPALAATARARLPDRPAASVPRPQSRAVVFEPARAQGLQTARAPAVERLRSGRLLIGVAAATAATVLFFDVRVEVGDVPASATPEGRQAAPVQPPATKPTLAKPKPTRKPAPVETRSRSRAPRGNPAPASSRRFAWAPTPSASGYHIEFFRGTKRVFARDTTGPAIEIPAQWRYGGVERSFTPGEYRWYVWPLIKGRRATRAAVQTTVSIPAG